MATTAAMASNNYRQQAPMPIDSAEDYDGTVSQMTPTPHSASAHGVAQMRAYEPGVGNTDDDTNKEEDEALLDLVQLEELHSEAERMKALGNKHMASQGENKSAIVIFPEMIPRSNLTDV